MKTSLRALSLVPCLLFLLGAATIAHATTYSISGSVWENGTTTNVPALGSSIYTTTPTATFTLTNSSATSLINFDSSNDIGLTKFLTTGYSPSGPNGDTLTYQTGSGAANDNINNDLFRFQGSTALTNGTYDFAHDDGLILYLTGNGVTNDAVIDAPGPTAAELTNFTVCASGCDATAGTYSFTLDYAEVDGAPAVLNTNLPLTGPPVSPIPEPGSILLLGTGLLAAAWVARRQVLA